MQIVHNPISRDELKKIAAEGFGDMVKAVVDVRQEKIAVGGELHADMQALLIESAGAKPTDVWGINLYPDATEDEFIEYDSLINLKPTLGNRTRSVNDVTVRQTIQAVVMKTML